MAVRAVPGAGEGFPCTHEKKPLITQVTVARYVGQVAIIVRYDSMRTRDQEWQRSHGKEELTAAVQPGHPLRIYFFPQNNGEKSLQDLTEKVIRFVAPGTESKKLWMADESLEAETVEHATSGFHPERRAIRIFFSDEERLTLFRKKISASLPAGYQWEDPPLFNIEEKRSVNFVAPSQEVSYTELLAKLRCVVESSFSSENAL